MDTTTTVMMMGTVAMVIPMVMEEEEEELVTMGPLALVDLREVLLREVTHRDLPVEVMDHHPWTMDMDLLRAAMDHHLVGAGDLRLPGGSA